MTFTLTTPAPSIQPNVRQYAELILYAPFPTCVAEDYFVENS